MSTKHCPGATKQEPHIVEAALFSPDRSRADGLAPYCKKCAATKQREWKHAHPEKVRAAKKKLRTTPEPLAA